MNGRDKEAAIRDTVVTCDGCGRATDHVQGRADLARSLGVAVLCARCKPIERKVDPS